MSNLFKIAIIIFPGTNCHEESFRAIKNVGLEPEFFRWNDDYKKLAKFDGYFIAGGFSYEDRVRSGAIAGRDPLMNIIKEQAKAGKPVIGICNGAQILVESGLIPGLVELSSINEYHLGAGLAWNNHGYLNIWTRIKNESAPGRCAFNNFAAGHHFALPIAHGEGRWVVPQDLLKQFQQNGQTVFRYCDENGEEKEEYPINPNGAMYNLAGVCNEAGNVLALMPHPERTKDGLVIFESMKKYLEEKTINKVQLTNNLQIPSSSARPNSKPITNYQKPGNALEILVDLIITDNEAQTLQTALVGLGYNNVKVKRFTHWEVETSDQSSEFIAELIKSGELLNTNKEIPYINQNLKLKTKSHNLLVRYKDDFVGQGKRSTLVNRLGFKQIKSIKQGVLWQLECSDSDWQKILASNILANPYSQDKFLYD
jgi:phosphoribosylformylglycinamidine synthase